MSEPPVLDVRDATKHCCRRVIHISDGKIVADDAPA